MPKKLGWYTAGKPHAVPASKKFPLEHVRDLSRSMLKKTCMHRQGRE